MKKTLENIKNVVAVIIIVGCFMKGLYEFEKTIMYAGFAMINKTEQMFTRTWNNIRLKKDRKRA
jgi:hypothetical protein